MTEHHQRCTPALCRDPEAPTGCTATPAYDWPARLRAMMAARLERKLKARARRDAMRTARSFGLTRRQAIKTVKVAQRERAAMARRISEEGERDA